MTCQFLKDSRCQLAESIATRAGLTLECRPDGKRCDRCLAKSPTEDQPPAACLGLVTPHVPADRRAAWVSYTLSVSGRPTASAVLPVVAQNRSRGLGDSVAKLTKAFGVQPCGGCQQRREWLNKMFPYKTTEPTEPT